MKTPDRPPDRSDINKFGNTYECWELSVDEQKEFGVAVILHATPGPDCKLPEDWGVVTIDDAVDVQFVAGLATAWDGWTKD